jgi:hypothetical protein
MFRFCSRASICAVVTGIGLLAASDAVAQGYTGAFILAESEYYYYQTVDYLTVAASYPCLDPRHKSDLLLRSERWKGESPRVSDYFRELVERVRKKPICGEPIISEAKGFFVGVEGVANFNSLSIRERDATSGVTTNAFNESSRGGEGGLIVGANTIILSQNFPPRPRPVERFLLSFDFFDQSTSHVFPTSPTTFIGATSKFMVTGELQLGVNVVPGVQIYGIGGFTVLNQDLNINFGGPFVTTQNNTTIGPTYGAGLSLQLPGSPITSFVQWEQTPFATATLPRPPASSSFNYDFPNITNRLKAGIFVDMRPLSRHP